MMNIKQSHFYRFSLKSFLLVLSVCALSLSANPLFAKTPSVKKSKVKTSLHQGNKYSKQFSGITLSLKTNPHFNYISEQVQKRNLPPEIALLPMLESNYKIHAVSNKGAAGLWQFMPATGKQFGLKQDGTVDERKDVKASTDAALTYLQYLHKKFNKNWELALAAYNAGEGTVQRAQERNKKAGKATGFYSLKLPAETQAYVPKFLAMKQDMYKLVTKN